MSKRTKYVPKHKHAPERSFVQAPKKALRTTVVMSSVAVAATGVAVSGGVLHDAPGVSSAAEDLGSSDSALAGSTPAAATPHSEDVDDRAERTEPVSRSSDRRDSADPVKEAALSVVSGPAETQEVDVADSDPRSIARALMPQFGFSSDQFGCLDLLWTKESGWNPSAENPSSGAYGIPQSLPGSKMASVGSDWQSNPVTQITWGLGYIRDSYGSPCGAWSHSQATGWY